LLFNLAIEPLAEILRKSDLAGYKTPEIREQAIVLLFADDTQVFLQKDDNFQTMTQILTYGAPYPEQNSTSTRLKLSQ